MAETRRMIGWIDEPLWLLQRWPWLGMSSMYPPLIPSDTVVGVVTGVGWLLEVGVAMVASV